MDEVLTQMWLLVDCINKKKEALEAILLLTNRQTDLILNAPSNHAAFNEIVQLKKDPIQRINELDGVFASIYDRIKDFMGKGNIAHREPMIALQNKIKEVTELSVDIKTREEKNARLLTGGLRKPPKRIVNTKQAMSAYKKNKKF